jgi:tetratricopeptide (TPR) repeat protein
VLYEIKLLGRLVKTILTFAVFACLIGSLRAQDDRIWLDGKINGQIVHFMFDTGTDRTGLFPEAVKRLGLEMAIPIPDIPPQDGYKVGVGKTRECELHILGTTLRTTFKVFPNGLFDAYDTLSLSDGLIGWSDVHTNVWIIGAATHTLQVVETVPKDAATWTQFRILTNYDNLALEIPGTGTNKLVVLVDSGKSAGVALSSERWRQWTTTNPERPQTLLAYRMFGIGNQLKTESWADKITIGSLALTDVPVMEANQAEMAAGSSGYAATLGMAALERLDLVIDGKNDVAYLRPKLTPPMAYQHNRLGAVFIREESLGNELFAWVAPGSPADEAGIHTGDILLQVDQQDVAGADTDPFLVPLIFTWNQSPGTKFDLTLQRASEVRKVTVVLRDILKPEKTSPVPQEVLAGEVQWLMDLGEMANQEADYKQLINIYSEVIRLQPDAAEAFNARGGAYYYQGSNTVALADYNEAIRLRPKYAMAFKNRGSLWQNAWQDEAKAIADYDVGIQLEPDDADAFHNRGVSYGLSGDNDRAIADFNESIRLNPKITRTYFDRGLGYQKQEKYDLAIADFSQALHLQPDFTDAIKARASVYLQKNDFASGMADLTEALRLNPHDVDALNNRGAVYWRSGNFDLAIADLTEALRFKPDSALALVNRGYAYAGKGENSQAIADFTRAIALDPENTMAFAGRANAYYAIDDYARSVADFSEVARSQSNNTAVFTDRGLAFEGEEKYDEAIADYTEAIRLDPNNAKAIGCRGNAFVKKKDFAHAISDYERAIQLEPSDFKNLAVAAQLLASCPDDTFRNGKKAVEYAQKACALTSWKDATSIDILAMAYAADGNFSEAVKGEEAFLRASLPEDVRAAAQNRLKLYQDNKPYRESER